jgi:uncharacterized LabA/DUF88 family protein
MSAKFGVLLDGGFVRVKLERALGRFPEPQDVLALTKRLCDHERLAHCELFRIYFYDAPPLDGSQTHPLTRRPHNFGRHPSHAKSRRLQDGLARSPDVAVRRGETVLRGWRLRQHALDDLRSISRQLNVDDFAPDIEQKGVDLRIGLDVAWLAVKRIVDIIVLVTGDSDFVPAMKFARREGLRIYLAPLGHGVRPGLVEHADFVFADPPAKPTRSST